MGVAAINQAERVAPNHARIGIRHFGTTLWGFLAALLVSLGIGGAARAQPARLYCEPACRPGFECQLGECVPSCTPPCGSGFVCAEGGRCIAESEQLSPAPLPGAAASQSLPGGACHPACGTGYQCVDGDCVTACNPACPLGYSCTSDRRCILAPEDDEPPPAPEERRDLDPTADSRWNLHTNALSPAQWGLSFTVEGGAKVSGYLSLRTLNAGVLPYFLLVRSDEDRFSTGGGGSVGMHAFTAKRGNRRGFYGGPALGYYFVATRDTRLDHARYVTHALVPQVDFGYRWAFDHLLLGVGLRFGVSLPAGHRDVPRGDYGCTFESSCRDERRFLPLPELVLDLGAFL